MSSQTPTPPHPAAPPPGFYSHPWLGTLISSALSQAGGLCLITVMSCAHKRHVPHRCRWNLHTRLLRLHLFTAFYLRPHMCHFLQVLSFCCCYRRETITLFIPNAISMYVLYDVCMCAFSHVLTGAFNPVTSWYISKAVSWWTLNIKLKLSKIKSSKYLHDATGVHRPSHPVSAGETVVLG